MTIPAIEIIFVKTLYKDEIGIVLTCETQEAANRLDKLLDGHSIYWYDKDGRQTAFVITTRFGIFKKDVDLTLTGLLEKANFICTVSKNYTDINELYNMWPLNRHYPFDLN
jgi:hypothetical protein